MFPCNIPTPVIPTVPSIPGTVNTDNGIPAPSNSDNEPKDTTS
ncbi:MAG: hypothetical protein ACYDDE_09435 [bacterium]